MSKICGIYKITSPTGRVYIGQSVDIKKRIRAYRYPEQVKSQRKLYNSLKKYGYKKHKIEIVMQCDIEKLDEMEIFYIDAYNTFNTKHGLNCHHGGQGHAIHSGETKRGWAESMKRRKVSEETKKRISETAKGRKRSSNQKLKISKTLVGRKFKFNTSSQYVGVSWNKHARKWEAKLKSDGKNVHLGYFDDELEASHAYQLALEKVKDGTFNHADYKPKYSSKYKLVYFRKDTMKWRSFINVDGKMKSLGQFKTEEEAYEARQKALKEYNL
jgi:group I intron endonuclease